MDLSFKYVVRGFCHWWMVSIGVCILIFLFLLVVKLIYLCVCEKLYNSKMSESADENEIVADVIDTVREINEEAGIFSLLDLDPFIRRLKNTIFSILAVFAFSHASLFYLSQG